MPNDRFSRILAGLAVVLAAVLCFMVYDSIYERVVEAGDSAPRFSIVTDAGKTVSTSSFGGKLLVLNFWATWCPPCIEELPSLNALQRQFGQQGLVVLGVSVDRNAAAYRQLLNNMPVAFQTARDPKADYAAMYGTFKFPETYIIDRSGKVLIKQIGPKDWMDPALLKQIQALL
jgi:peroxiredoxin